MDRSTSRFIMGFALAGMILIAAIALIVGR